MQSRDATNTTSGKTQLWHACALVMSACIVVGLVGCERNRISGRKPEIIFGDKGLGPGQFVYPRAITIGPDGRVFIVDKTARIQRFSPDGQFETSWQMPIFKAGKPTGITVDADGRVLVADTHYNQVIIFDREGKELKRFGTEGSGPGEFLLPTAVAIDPKGRYYVSEYGGNDRISRFSADLEYIDSFGSADAGQAALLRPQAIIFDPDGTLWVADASHHRICRFSDDGKLLSSFGSAGSEPGQLNYPYDLAICPDGTLLVSEFGNNRLQRFDRNGKSLEIWGSTGRSPGQLLGPWGVVIGKDKRVYVLDSVNNRVQMFRL